ncbi:beta strand repeat-containing protein [Rhodoblastus sp.]|uniref:beta strand repeat-containing protein n=1 Tax=Rhodoblastus sp. TaxID=1962975 RepID=UPI003F9C217A
MILPPRRSVLLTSCSLAALLVGACPAAVWAQTCYTGPFPLTTSASYNCVNITGQTFTGNFELDSPGTISPGSSTGVGILLNNASMSGALAVNGSISAPVGIELIGSTISSGIIFQLGTLGGGIKIDSASHVTGASDAIWIQSGTLSGGIVNAGVISGGLFGLRAQPATFTGGISNSGTIRETIAGGVALDVFGSELFSGGISNSGQISAIGAGVVVGYIPTFVGGISNSGTIAATTQSTANGVLVLNSTINGNISNSGTISGVNGINIGGGAINGAIIDSGVILATNQGIVIDAASKITSSLSGISITGPTFAGGISNAGTISAAGAGAGINMEAVHSFLGGVANSGTIAAGGDGIAFDGYTVGGTTFSGGVSNSGTISAGAWGVSLFDISSFSGGVSNSGSISAGNTGVQVSTVTGFSSGISNSGTISSGLEGVSVANVTSFSGGVVNSGLISSSSEGGVSVYNVASFHGGITNAANATIAGVSFPIYVSTVSAFTGGITNSGLISTSGSQGGIFVTTVSNFSGDIVNSSAGKIIGSGNGTGVGVNVSTFTGGISNAGTISNFVAAIQVGGNSSSGSFQGDIVNAGTLSARDYGVWVYVAPSLFNGGITNTGTITTTSTSGGMGINIQGSYGSITGNISNSGTINVSSGTSGTGIYASFVNFAANSAIDNTGTISGATAIATGNFENTITINQNGGLLSGAIQMVGYAALNVNGGTINGAINGSEYSQTVNVNNNAVVNGNMSFSSSSTATVNLNNSNFNGGIANDDATLTVNFNPGAGQTYDYGANNIATTNVGVTTNVSIASGTVIMNGVITASSVNVASGAELSGVGTFTGMNATANTGQVTVGGTLSPGVPGSVGILTVKGGVTFASGATFQDYISGANSSQLNASAAVTLGGASVDIASGSTISTGTQYILLTDTANNLGVGGNTFSPTVSYNGEVGNITYGNNNDDVFLTFAAPASCYTGPFPHTNSGSIPCIQATNTSFAGNIGNTGVISPGAPSSSPPTGVAILLSNATLTGNITNSGTISAPIGISLVGATVNGQIVDSGVITASAAGILIDAHSTINVSGANNAIIVSGPTFLGGISNAGSVAAGYAAIAVGNNSTPVAMFSGGIVNTGVLTSNQSVALAVGGGATTSISTFSGNVVNQGTINGWFGVMLDNIQLFAGNLSNSGTINSASGGAIGPQAIYVENVSTFAGNIINSGTISGGSINNGASHESAIYIGPGVNFGGDDGVVNSGVINAGDANVAIDASAATSPVTINQTGGTISGNILLSPNADIVNISGGTVSGDIIGQGSSDTVNFNPGSGKTFTYASPYGFSGVNQANIQSGTVALNGVNSANEITVNANATLAGTGTLNVLSTETLTVNNNATLWPGVPGSVGTLTVNGDVVFSSGATYEDTIIGSSAGLTSITGGATLGDASVVIASGSSVSAGKYIILTDTTEKFGATYDNVFATTTVVVDGLVGTVGYDPYDVYITFAAPPSGGCYTGPFPHTNGGSIPCIQATNTSFAGNIGNAGTISPGAPSSSPPTGVAILLSNATLTGNIFNSGTISAPVGISLVGATINGYILDQGALSGTTSGILIDSKGAINSTVDAIIVSGSSFSGGVSNAGHISAQKVGIYVGLTTHNNFNVSSFGGGIANSGHIAAGTTGVVVYGVQTFQGGIINSASGTITGLQGVYVANVSSFGGGISNAGLISVSGSLPANSTSNGESGIGVEVGAPTASNHATAGTFTNGVTNSGTISVAFTNAKSINAGAAGVSVILGATHSGVALPGGSFSGGVVNTGAISVALTNTGNILGGAGGLVALGAINSSNSAPSGSFSDGLFNSGSINVDVTNSGQIFGGAGGMLAAYVSSFSGGITNSASGVVGVTYSGPGLAAGLGAGYIPNFSGDISNAGHVTVQTSGSGVYGVGLFVDYVDNFTGNLFNSGTISAPTGGLAVGYVSYFNGGLTNSGSIGLTFAGAGSTIAGGLALAMVSNFTGNISNSGTISVQVSGAGQGAGVLVEGVGSFTGNISNSGTISAPTGVSLVGAEINGAIRDSGVISATSHGILIDAASIIFATKTAISITGPTVAGGISNAGSISAGGSRNGINVNGVTSFSGGISNSGVISLHAAFGYGVAVDNTSSFSGGISNSGTISATGSYAGGIYLGSGSFGGGIGNSGTILAGWEGIYVSGVSQFGSSSAGGGIINTGRISAGATGISVNNGTSFFGGITNTGTISSTLYRGINIDGVPTFSGGISNGGAIIANHTGIYVNVVTEFSGNISNSGAISAAYGILIENKVTFAAGSAIINSGTISGSTAAIDVSSGAGSPVTITQTGGLISGAIMLSAEAAVLNVNGGTINGNIVGQGLSDTVNFNPGAGNTFTYASAYGFSQIQQVNIDSGTVVLNGANAAEEVVVNSGATLAGDGTLNVLSYATLTVNNGATLSPGVPGSIGTLNVNGEVVFNSGATYAIEISPTAASKTAITGAATLGGATVAVTPELGSYSAHTYTILTATQAVGFGSTNTFNPTVTVTQSGLFADPTLTYDANDVYLSVQSYIKTLNLTPPATLNAQNAAGALNTYILAGNALPSGMQGLSTLSGATLNAAVNQLAGQQQGAFALGAIKADDLFLNLMLNPHVGGREDWTSGAAPGFRADASGKDGSGAGGAFWGGAYGGGETVSGNAFTGAARESGSIYGYAAGVDFHVQPDMIVGFALGGGGTGFSLGDGLGSGSSQMFQAGVYGALHSGPAYIATASDYTLYDATTTRLGALAGVGTQSGQFTATSLANRVEGGYAAKTFGVLTVTPYAANQVQALMLPGFAENAQGGIGSAFSLDYGSHDPVIDRTELGLRFDLAQPFGGGLDLYGRVAWAHDFGDLALSTVFFQSVPTNGFRVYSANPAPNGALLTLGGEYGLGGGWTATAKFEGEFSSTTNYYGAMAELRKNW